MDEEKFFDLEGILVRLLFCTENDVNWHGAGLLDTWKDHFGVLGEPQGVFGEFVITSENVVESY